MERKVKLEDEMRTSYLSYAMSVIIGRAIPDVRDGLKPVQRRLLWSMWESKITPRSSFRKSARIVGDVIGKYHPHGEVPVYEALVRMAQPFTLRYPLVEGQGNFGSIDGDEPAAMRYTEAKMSEISTELLKDIEEGAVDFLPNYDETLIEPDFLPTRIPNLILNGASGIAVGMTTSIPPHNLGEICEAINMLIDNPHAQTNDILKFVKGPDFPIGGKVTHKGELEKIYETGRGQFWIYARYRIEDTGKVRRLVFYEVPYQTNKAKIVERIATLVRERIIDGILRVRDESDRSGIRITVELRKDENSDRIAAKLYELTPLKIAFSVNMLVIDGGRPVIMSLKDILLNFINMRKEVILRKTKFRLKKTEERLHILEGFLKVLTDIDAVIKTIEESEDYQDALNKLVERFKFTERQSRAILDMRLARLSKLERESIEAEFLKLREEAEEYRKILKVESLDIWERAEGEKELRKIMKNEMSKIKEEYISNRLSEVVEEVEVEEEEVIVSLTWDGYVKRGIKIPKTGLKRAFLQRASSDILVIGSSGKVYKVKPSKIRTWTEKGVPARSLVRLKKEEDVVDVLPGEFIVITPQGGAKRRRRRKKGEKVEVKRELVTIPGFLVTMSEDGRARKVPLEKLNRATASGMKIMPVKIACAEVTSGNDKLFVITKRGLCIGFDEKELTPMRISTAVKVDENDKPVAVLRENGKYLVVLQEDGFIKRISSNLLKMQKKGGKGIIIAKKEIIGASFVDDNDEIIITNSSGKSVSLKLDRIPLVGKTALGKRVHGLGKEPAVCIGKLPAR